jgi:hypothetical protein
MRYVKTKRDVDDFTKDNIREMIYRKFAKDEVHAIK